MNKAKSKPGALALQCAKEDITQRLDKIVRHFNQQSSFRKECRTFQQVDSHTESPETRYAAFQDLVARMTDKDIEILNELVHLRDNVRRYLRLKHPVIKHKGGRASKGRSAVALGTVEESYSYSVASNLINVHKHGMRGENHDSAVFEFDVYFYGADPDGASNLGDNIVGVTPLINFRGDLFQSDFLVSDLMHLWEMFFRNYTSLDVKPFRKTLRDHDRLRLAHPIKYMELSRDFLKHAKQTADQRRLMAAIENVNGGTANPESQDVVSASEVEIKSSFKNILQGLLRREIARRKLPILPPVEQLTNDAVREISRPIQLEEVQTMRELIALVPVLRRYARENSLSTKGLIAIERHQAFQIATIVTSKSTTEDMSKIADSGFLLQQKADPPVNLVVDDAIQYTVFEQRMYSWPGVIMDLVTMMTMLVRSQTKIDFIELEHSLLMANRRNIDLIEFGLHFANRNNAKHANRSNAN